MRLLDLDPKLADSGWLRFDCPTCTPQGNAHGIRIPLSPAVDRHGLSWQHAGTFPDTITIWPSIDAGCWHGNIIAGEIKP